MPPDDGGTAPDADGGANAGAGGDVDLGGVSGDGDPDPDDYRARLYELRAADLPPAEKYRRLLAVGRSYLGVGGAHLKRIDRDRGVHEVVVAVGEDAAPGDRHDHATTFCRRTVERATPLALPDVPDSDWADDPAAEVHDLACYLGATVTVDGDRYGTVCFVDADPRESFSPTEQTFVELLATAVGEDLARRRRTGELADRERLLDVLNRVLRHNCRNDLTVVRGFAAELAADLDGEYGRTADVVRQNVAELLELTETARRLDDVSRSDASVAPRDVAGIVRTVAERLPSSGGEVRVQAPPEATAFATPHVETAVRELGENALEHAGDDPTVTLRVDASGCDPDGDPDSGGDRSPDRVTIAVSDDGPGLPSQERRVLQSGEETNLEHGSGLGTFLVNWIVAAAGGTVDVTVDDGTTVAVGLRAATGGASPPCPYLRAADD